MRLKIKELREENGFTQRQLAVMLGNAQRNVSNWEIGTSEPDCETILKLADIFKVSIDELFGRETSGLVYTYGSGTIPEALYSLTESQMQAVVDLIKTFKS